MGDVGRFCTACGNALSATAAFCGACGQAVAAASAPEPPVAATAAKAGKRCPQCAQVDRVFSARDLIDREFTKAEVAAAEEAGMGDPEAAQIFLDKPEKPGDGSLGFWLLLPFIPVLNFILCWMAPMRRSFKFFMAGVVIVFWICVAVPSLYQAGAYAFVGCFFILYYYAALLIDRKRQATRLATQLIPAYEQAMQRWDQLHYCQRCDIAWLDGNPMAFVAVEDVDKIL